ncbi:lipid catabolic process [Musa troglodytarum]|uniref:Lipid catabolic process n=1 Tax=Musa troglodytarum TaxID=320322 RepID=A0A9E7ETG1_9LILI|nr:lipid catabolic process [Musa troglodytarum]
MAPSFSARLSLHVILLSVDLLLLSSVVTPSPGCYSAIFNFGDSLTDTGNLAFLTGGKAPASRPPYGETYFHRPTGRFTDGRIILDFIGCRSFGDSLTDTGNLVFFSGGKDQANRPPYGETYFHRPNGRYSDGRIILDFIAQTTGLPLVRPYPAGRGSEGFVYGANFAVAGGCALSNAFYEAEGFNVTWEDYSLGTQLKWFEQLLSSPSVLAPNDALSKSLFIVGEMGANDYSSVLVGDNPMESARALVAPVARAIGAAIDALVRTGAKTVLVSGVFPLGCVPLFLTRFRTRNAEAYDPATGCLKWLNEFSQYHNLLLQRELRRLRRAHPHSTIIYADIYGALMAIYTSPSHFGMTSTLKACCGGEGPYNYDSSVTCGDPTSTLCSDPWSYVSWDGLHFTEAASQIVAHGIADGPNAQLSLDENIMPVLTLRRILLLWWKSDLTRNNVIEENWVTEFARFNQRYGTRCFTNIDSPCSPFKVHKLVV